MSNFLQRLALSASHPEGNIHPILSPMFSPPTPRVQGNGLEIEESTTPDAQIAQARPGLEAVPSDSPLIKSASAASEAQPQAAVPGAAEPAKHPDAFSVYKTDPRLPNPIGFPKETGANDARLPDQGGQAPEDEAPPANLGRIPLTPLLAATQIPAEPGEIQPNRPRVAPALGMNRRQPRPGAQRAELPDRQPDEIQIHIGRIEVIAAAPVVATTALPKPRDETSSLDKYLRRRDGKAI